MLWDILMAESNFTTILQHNGTIFSNNDGIFKHKILNIYQLYEYFVGIFVYKSLNHSLPDMFSNIFVHNKTSRNALDLRPGLCSKKSSEFSIRNTGPKIWDKLLYATKQNYQRH